MGVTDEIGQFLSLTDHFGNPVSADSFKGRYLLIYFGFTRCKVVCPRNLSKICDVLAHLGLNREKLLPIFVTVDPVRDSPAVLREFLECNYPCFLGLTGSESDIAEAKSSFRVHAEKRAHTDSSDDYDVPHTSITYLLGRNGEYVSHFPEHLTAVEIAQRFAGSFEF